MLGANGTLQSEPTWTRIWEEFQVKNFAKDFRREHANGLRYLTEDAQRAFLDAFILNIVTTNHRETMPLGAIAQLRMDLRDALHLSV